MVNLSINGATLEKTHETTAWISGALSRENSFADCWVEFRFLAFKYSIMGLSKYNTSEGIASVDYGIYSHINGKAYVHENNQRRKYPGSSNYVAIPYTSTDIFRVERKNGVIKYLKNGAVFYTSQVLSSQALYADCSFNQDQAKIAVSAFMFGNVWSGNTNDDWNTASNWSLNRAPTSGDQATINTCTVCPKLMGDTEITALQVNGGSLNLSGFTLTVLGQSSLVQGRVLSNNGRILSTDFMQVKDSEFSGKLVLEKTGGVGNECYGGNIFSTEVKFINSSSEIWNIATDAENVISLK